MCPDNPEVQLTQWKMTRFERIELRKSQPEKKQLLRPLGEARGQKSRIISTAILQEYQNYEFNALDMISVFNSK